MGVRRSGNWRVSRKDHMYRDVGVAGAIATGIRLGENIEHRVKEVKNVVSGCNGTRNLGSR